MTGVKFPLAFAALLSVASHIKNNRAQLPTASIVSHLHPSNVLGAGYLVVAQASDVPFNGTVYAHGLDASHRAQNGAQS